MQRLRDLWANTGLRRSALAAVVVVVVGALLLTAYTAGAEARLMRADPDAVVADAAMMRFAVPKGRAAFETECAVCHGAQARGDRTIGAPDLTDADYLYGSGLPSELEKTITYGIRSLNPKGWNLTIMPAFGTPEPSAAYRIPPLNPRQIDDTTAFVLYLSGRKAADPEAVARGSKLYADKGGCYDCHSSDGAGDSAIGAPNLTDNIWLFGDGSFKTIRSSIAWGHQGRCPAWINRLPSARIREVALYVYTLSHRPSPGPAKAS